MSLRTNIIIGVIVGIALLVGGYLFFFNSSGSVLSALSSGTPDSQVSTVEQNFIQLSSEASSINFDTTILTDWRFKSLVNTNTPIVPVSTGRPDPFAPLPGSGS